jgi:hypothetical protein
MKKFRIQIFAYKMHGDFTVDSLDTPQDIENAIIDKLGQNDIKWEHLGEMNDPRVKRITYEEVINGDATTTSTGPVHEEEGSGSRMGAGAS